MVAYKDLLMALVQNGIEFLVAGGFAVNFHQVQRATVDLDLIVHLEKDNVLAFDRVMTTLGYHPRVPVTGTDFADPAMRKQWMEEKNMVVFSYIHPRNHFDLIDIFVEEPKPFHEMAGRQLSVDFFGVKIPVVGLDDLLDMKRRAGRDKDLFDIQQLEKKKNALSE